MLTYKLYIVLQVHVSAIENPEEASFFESFEAAHSLHDLSSRIANVLPSLPLLPPISFFVATFDV